MIVSPCRSPAISLYAEVSVPSIWISVGSGSALWPRSSVSPWIVMLVPAWTWLPGCR